MHLAQGHGERRRPRTRSGGTRVVVSNHLHPAHPVIVRSLSGAGGSTSCFFLTNDYKGVSVALVGRVPGNLREVTRSQGSSCSSGFLIRLSEVTQGLEMYGDSFLVPSRANTNVALATPESLRAVGTLPVAIVLNVLFKQNSVREIHQ